MAGYEGRLELTWTNKGDSLLAHDDGRYEWLSPSDYRVAEVRLLHDVEVVGEVGAKRSADNLLIHGDALHALTSLTKLPEFRDEVAGNVKLAYRSESDFSLNSLVWCRRRYGSMKKQETTVRPSAS